MSKFAEVGDRVEVRFGEGCANFVVGNVLYVPSQSGDMWAVDCDGTVYQFMKLIYIKVIKKGE